MHELKRKAKRDVLKDLHMEAKKMLKGEDAEDMMPVQKVSVMAPDKEALKEGLNKAEDLVEKLSNGEDEGASEEQVEQALDASEDLEESLDKDKLDELIHKLQMMRDKASNPGPNEDY